MTELFERLQKDGLSNSCTGIDMVMRQSEYDIPLTLASFTSLCIICCHTAPTGSRTRYQVDDHTEILCEI